MEPEDQPIPHAEVHYPDLQGDRLDAVARLLEQDRRELIDLEKALEAGFKAHESVTVDPGNLTDARLTFGERLADRVAAFGGSWPFILLFGGFLVVWVGVNAVVAALRFDPYPFILLNLVLSCLAALQAPVIMMSQNRQEAKDRLPARAPEPG